MEVDQTEQTEQHNFSLSPLVRFQTYRCSQGRTALVLKKEHGERFVKGAQEISKIPENYYSVQVIFYDEDI